MPLWQKERNATSESVIAEAKALAKLAYGVMFATKGLGIRVKSAELAAAKEARNPELAKAVGQELMRLCTGDSLVL